MRNTLIFSLLTLFGTIPVVNAQLNLNKLKEKAIEKTQTNADNSSNSSGNSADNNSEDKSQKDSDDTYSEWVRGKCASINGIESVVSSIKHSSNFDMDEYIADAKELDYPATLKKLKEKGVSTADADQYNRAVNFGEKYKTYWDEDLKSTINNKIEEAYKNRKDNESEAIGSIKDAQKLAEAAFLILPDNADVISLKADADKSFNEIAGAYSSKVFTSDFHKNNAGKILFSKTPIVVGKEDPNQFTTKFTAADNIYAIIYFNGILNDLQSTSGAAYELLIDGSTNKYINFGHNPEDMKNSWYPVEIMPAVDKAYHSIDCKEFAKVLTDLSPRTHTIKFTYSGNYTKLAEGEFTIDLAGMDAAKITANAEKASTNAQDNWDRNKVLPDVFKKNGLKYADPELNETVLRSILMNEWQDCAQILKIVYSADNTSNEWDLNKNDVGIPTSKTTHNTFAVIYKGKDGWCYYVTWVSMRKEYEGAGKYGSVRFYLEPEHSRIDCKNCM